MSCKDLLIELQKALKTASDVLKDVESKLKEAGKDNFELIYNLKPYGLEIVALEIKVNEDLKTYSSHKTEAINYLSKNLSNPSVIAKTLDTEIKRIFSQHKAISVIIKNINDNCPDLQYSITNLNLEFSRFYSQVQKDGFGVSFDNTMTPPQNTK